MNCKAWPSLLALALVGCFNPVAPSNGDPPVNAEPPINGELRIEVQLPPANEQGIAPEAFVFLGDGTRYLQRLGENGRAVFTDPSLTGPQDITVVWSYPQADGKYSRTNVHTALEVNRREVYLEPYSGLPTPVPEKEPVLTVTGRVLGISEETRSNIIVFAFSGEHVYGEVSRGTQEGFPGGVFEFSMGMKDVPEGPLTFVAYEMKTGVYAAHRAGIVKGVMVGTAENAPVDIAIAPFATESIRFIERSGSEKSVRAIVSISEGRLNFFETYVYGALPAEVPALSLEGEWAGLTRTACLSDWKLPGNQMSFATAPLGSSTSVSLDLFDFPTFVEPSITGQLEPVAVSATEPLELVWKVDSRADAVSVVLLPESPEATQWKIEAPASRTTFSARPLPEALAHLKLETKGAYEIVVGSMKAEKLANYSAHFVRRPPIGLCAAYEGGSQSYASTSGRFVRE